MIQNGYISETEDAAYAEKYNAKKRQYEENEDEEEEEEDIKIYDFKDTIAYHAKALKRIQAKTVPRPVPPGKGLTTPCLIWTANQNNGYGKMYYRSKNCTSHRIVYMIQNGLEVLPKFNENGEPLEVLHKCDVTLCCEKTHLVFGTKADNGLDRVKNGASRGEKNHNASIDENTARAIKASKPIGVPQGTKGRKSALDRALDFGVSVHVVRDIDQGRTWGHLPFSDGSTSENKMTSRNKTRKIRKDKLRKIPFTKEEYDEILITKLRNPEYVKKHETLMHEGTSCMEWMAARVTGYGQMTMFGRTVKPHVIACTINNNYVRLKGLDAAHQCNFPYCVEPTHLKFETRAENVFDRIEHGTHAKKFTFEQITEMREEYKRGGVTYHDLAQKYNMNVQYVRAIIHKKNRIHG